MQQGIMEHIIYNFSHTVLVTALPALVLLPSVINRAYRYAYCISRDFQRIKFLQTCKYAMAALQKHSFEMFEVAITFVKCSQKFSKLLICRRRNTKIMFYLLRLQDTGSSGLRSLSK